MGTAKNVDFFESLTWVGICVYAGCGYVLSRGNMLVLIIVGFRQFLSLIINIAGFNSYKIWC